MKQQHTVENAESATTQDGEIYLGVDCEKVKLGQASNDALYSARSHAWREVLSSINPRNICGQRLRGKWMSHADAKLEKENLIKSRRVIEMENELLRRGLDPKSKDYIRVSASLWHGQ